MAGKRLVTVVGATGSQGGAVVRSLVESGKYKIRGLTRDANSESALSVKRLSDNVEMVSCDINEREDVQRAFKDSWAVFGLTNFWGQPDKPEIELHQGKIMADVAASQKIPYFIFSTLENVEKLSNGKYNVPHFTQKAQIRDYIQQNHPTLKAIYVEPAFYMQNWIGSSKGQNPSDDNVIFTAPINENTTLHMTDIEDTGPVVREILNDPDKFIGKDICICGEAIRFGDISKVFTKVTGVPSISKSLSEAEYRSTIGYLSKNVQDELFNMFKWFEEYGYYGKDKDWTTGKKLTSVHTFEDWLKKTGWKGK